MRPMDERRKWYRWYAWHPVKCIDGNWRWMETVWRKEKEFPVRGRRYAKSVSDRKFDDYMC